MILQSVMIRRAKWDHTGPLQGHITFKGESGEITLNLDETMSKRVLDICADEIVKASKAVANHMTAEVITALPAPEKATA